MTGLRPYPVNVRCRNQSASDCWHEALLRRTLWLNSGVPATEVVRRAGHGVAVLLKIYAHCIDGQADAANQRITDALSTPEADHDPGKKGDDDSEPAA